MKTLENFFARKSGGIPESERNIVRVLSAHTPMERSLFTQQAPSETQLSRIPNTELAVQQSDGTWQKRIAHLSPGFLKKIQEAEEETFK